MRSAHWIRSIAISGAMVASAACQQSMPPSAGTLVTVVPRSAIAHRFSLKTPAVIAYDGSELVYWPLKGSGGANPRPFSNPLSVGEVFGMVADGNVVTLASYTYSDLVSYDVDTGATSELPDANGPPYDVAVDTHHNLYALNQSGVVVYNGVSESSVLSCAYVTIAQFIAVNNEGDVLVNGYGPNGFTGVVEYPSGSSTCLKLPLKKPERGYVAGLSVDPSTDDLIVEDNPQLCAGGSEGRVVVYTRPYGPNVVAVHNLGANCPGPIRLDAAGTRLLFGDGYAELPSRGRVCAYSCIDQRTYPGGRKLDVYNNAPGIALTTIPNRLPN